MKTSLKRNLAAALATLSLMTVSAAIASGAGVEEAAQPDSTDISVFVSDSSEDDSNLILVQTNDFEDILKNGFVGTKPP